MGGAVFCRGGLLNAVFDTFSGNTAGHGGTDVYVLSDSSDGGNYTSPGSGAATAVLTDDVLGQSRSPVSDFAAASNDGASWPALSGSHDFISNNAPGGMPQSAVVNAPGADPDLGHLGMNGGPTPTMVPNPGSPLLAAGVAADYPGTTTEIQTDKRGADRSYYFDIGACEVTQAQFVI
jgi:hypothetical protein